MPDIARLGLQIDTSQARKGKADLNALVPAAKSAETAFAGLEKAAKKAAPAQTELTKQTGLARHEMVNLSRQVQDIGVSLASGQSPFLVLIQQGTQVGDIFASTTGTVRGFAGQLLSVVTPARVLGGVVALIAATTIGGAVSWKNYALSLDDTARAAGTTAANMAKLQAVASFKGINSKEFSDGIGRFAEQVYLAKNNMGGLADVFRANNVHAKDFDTALERAADLIRNASSDQQRLVLLQQMGLPATMQWVRLLSGGADGLRKAKQEAAEFGGAANDNLVQKARQFDEAWNKATTNFGLRWRGLFVDLIQGFDALVGKAEELSKKSPWQPGPDGDAARRRARGNPMQTALRDQNATFAERFGAIGGSIKPLPTFRGGIGSDAAAGGTAGTPSPTVDPEAIRKQLSLEQQRIAVLGQLVTVQQAVRAQEVAIALARLDGVRITNAEADALRKLAIFQAEQGKLQQQTQYGIFDAGRQAANAARELEVLWKSNVITNAQQYADALAVVTKRQKELADSAAVARSPFEQLTRFQLDATNLAKGFDQVGVNALRGFEDAIISIGDSSTTTAQKFSKMALGILQDIERMVIRSSITGPLAGVISSAFGGVFGTGGGGISGNSDIGGSIPRNATGTNDWRGGLTQVNESGGEIINLPKGTQIIPHDVSMQMAQRLSGGGNRTVVNIHNAPQGTTTRQNDEGGVDVFLPKVEDWMASRVARNHGSLAKTVRGTHDGRQLRG